MKLIKKISVKTVCGKREQEIIGKDNGKDVIGFKDKDVMDVVGVCTATRTGNTTFGDFIGLRGQFQATNLESGEVVRSSQCFLPDDVTDLIVAQLSMDGVSSVEFAFRIGQKASNTSIGYEYTAIPLLDTQQNDPINSILLKLEDKGAKNSATGKAQNKHAKAAA